MSSSLQSFSDSNFDYSQNYCFEELKRMEIQWIESLLWNSSVGMMLIGIVTYIALVHFVTAPYGKFAQSKGWGPLIPAKLGWIIMETPNLWMTALIYFLSKNNNLSLPIEGSLTNKVLLALYLTHYINRSLIFPNFLTHGNPMPISVTFAAFIYCSWNGLNQSLSLVVVNEYNNDYLTHPRCLIGIGLFILGMYLNIKSDFILINLKKEIVEKNKKDGINAADLPPNKKYVIPHGGLYDYVTSANYFGEVIEWVGFAIACHNITAWSFAIYTFCNLAPRAYAQHAWYHKTFDNYPKDRKAIIPFIL